MDNLLQIEQLETVLHTSDAPIRAVDRLSLSIAPGETFALLGESGCGKSMTALSIMRLLPDVGEIIAGKVKIHGTDILQLPETGMRKIRGKRISMIFQEKQAACGPPGRRTRTDSRGRGRCIAAPCLAPISPSWPEPPSSPDLRARSA